MVEFKDMLKYFRHREGLTQQELADKIGLSRSRINNYEQGIRTPDYKALEMFADFFHTDTDILLAREASRSDVDLSDEERGIISAYRRADNGTRSAVKKLLDVDFKPVKKEVI